MGKKFLVLCIILLIHFQHIGFFFPLADTDSIPIPQVLPASLRFSLLPAAFPFHVSMFTFHPMCVCIYICLFVWLQCRIFDLRFSIVSCGTRNLAMACGIQLSYQGLKPGPLSWEHGAIVTGLPGKSQFLIFHQTLSYHNLKQSELPFCSNY